MLERRVQTVCLAILTTIGLAFALWWLRPVMIPFVLALFISMGLRLGVRLLVTRARVPRAFALPVTLVLGIGAMAGLGGLASASIGQLAENAPIYNQQLQELLDRPETWIPAPLQSFDLVNYDRLKEIPVAAVGGVLAKTTNALLGVLSQSFLVLIFVVFLMMGSRPERATGTTGEIQSQVQTYLVSKILISGATGILVGVVLSLLGIPLAMAFGLVAFLLNFIPSIGSIIATLLPLPVALASPDVSGTAATLAIVLPGAIQLGVGNILEPKIMGDSLDLHPVTVLINLIFWGMLWGIVGMLLAVPITAVVKIFLSKFDGTHGIAELMAGRTDALLGSAPDAGAAAERMP
jgi:AI-2 transport protein TqsA